VKKKKNKPTSHDGKIFPHCFASYAEEVMTLFAGKEKGLGVGAEDD